MKPAKGFTLIELVVVIVILGILAATALPKFVDLGKDARKADVNSLAGAVRAAAELAHMKCQVTSGCNDSGSGLSGGGPLLSPKGISGTLHYGYPTGQDRTAGGGYFSIDQWMDFSGFSAVSMATSMMEFRKDGATEPNNCKVTYYEPAAIRQPPTIVIDVSNC